MTLNFLGEAMETLQRETRLMLRDEARAAFEKMRISAGSDHMNWFWKLALLEEAHDHAVDHRGEAMDRTRAERGFGIVAKHRRNLIELHSRETRSGRQ